MNNENFSERTPQESAHNGNNAEVTAADVSEGAHAETTVLPDNSAARVAETTVLPEALSNAAAETTVLPENMAEAQSAPAVEPVAGETQPAIASDALSNASVESAVHAASTPTASTESAAPEYAASAAAAGQIYAPPQPQVTAQPVSEQMQNTHAASRKNFGWLALGVSGLVLLAGVGGGMLGASLVSGNQSAAAGNTIEISGGDTDTAVSAIAAARTESVVTLEVTTQNGAGSGSGVIYSADGYIITNAHVVAADGTTNGQIRVRMSNGELLPAELVGIDPYADLAVVKVDRENLTPMPIADSSTLDVGDLTVAIGAPLELSSTVTSGIVSAVNRGIAVSSALIEDPTATQEDNSGSDNWQFELPNQQQQQTQTSNSVTLPVIQTDASINPGNSGGALLNGEGELIGINVAIASTSSSQETAGSVGLGFAIPVDLAVRVVDAIIAGETPSHGLLGANVADAAQSANSTHTGGLIAGVVANSPAAKAGLREGDIVTAVDGVAAADGTSVSALVRMHEAGSEITVDYIRDGKPQSATITLGSL